MDGRKHPATAWRLIGVAQNGRSLQIYRHRKGEPMRRLALAFALGIAVSIIVLPPDASAWTRGGHGHGVVVAGPGFVVAGPRVPGRVPGVRPFPPRVVGGPRPGVGGPG